MSLDKATVARIAVLARIEVPEAEQERLAGELSQILGWIEQLGEVDTEGVEPMRSVMPIKARWRPDAVTDGDRQGDVLANAPSAHDGYFVVPKVVE
ncbi:MAG TPA: Asp-tRNA(Asn)/Glu-tRNA(Gln) amidotransferase subunit GatC [Geminicoccaceae bacterium]|jgi:aspartyl-tRNA(Asn)/glutamyl-tRNA(Gln) amidotransferase subunit C|nr:Asp-tRNA(Asn)/Glu-tRNA(Gln) amidotransferase subunit GatC [Geminicoccaceae bacterium]